MIHMRRVSASIVGLLLAAGVCWAQRSPAPNVGRLPCSEEQAQRTYEVIDPTTYESEQRYLESTPCYLEADGTCLPMLVKDCLRMWAILWELGKYQEAATLAEEAHRLDPNNMAVQHALVLSQLARSSGFAQSACSSTPSCTYTAPCPSMGCCTASGGNAQPICEEACEAGQSASTTACAAGTCARCKTRAVSTRGAGKACAAGKKRGCSKCAQAKAGGDCCKSCAAAATCCKDCCAKNATTACACGTAKSGCACDKGECCKSCSKCATAKSTCCNDCCTKTCCTECNKTCTCAQNACCCAAKSASVQAAKCVCAKAACACGANCACAKSGCACGVSCACGVHGAAMKCTFLRMLMNQAYGPVGPVAWQGGFIHQPAPVGPGGWQGGMIHQPIVLAPEHHVVEVGPMPGAMMLPPWHGVAMPHPPMYMPCARPMPPTANMTSSEEEMLPPPTIVSSPRKAMPVQVMVRGNGVRVVGQHFEASCERMSFDAASERIILEGNVHLTTSDRTQTCRIVADRVLVSQDGSFQVNGAGNVQSTPVSSKPTPNSY